MAICAHDICTCETAEGTEFCSQWCADNPSEGECHCHHPECRAPHHH